MLKITKFLILFKLLFIINIYNYAYANQFLPKHKAIPGGIAIIPLDIRTIESPIVYFNNKQVLVIKYYNDNEKTNNWVAIIGIPVTTKPGMQKIAVHADRITNDINNPQFNKFKINFEKNFLVAAKSYAQEALTIDPNKVTPLSGTDRLRAVKETESIKQAYQYWSEQLPNLKLIKPVAGRTSAAFGVKRILNGKNKGYHSGLDVAAPIGSPINAAGGGQVILTGNFFYTGNTIFIDHGHGLITSYFHLNSINVAEGDIVGSDKIIGTVGATGRVTGPHLHWSVSLNDARINPEFFLD